MFDVEGAGLGKQGDREVRGQPRLDGPQIQREIGAFADQADATGSFTIGGSESLPAQAVLYATAQQPLLGEEVFALPAYLGAGSYHQASLRVQDWLRWGIVVVLIVGTLLSVALG